MVLVNKLFKLRGHLLEGKLKDFGEFRSLQKKFKPKRADPGELARPGGWLETVMQKVTLKIANFFPERYVHNSGEKDSLTYLSTQAPSDKQNWVVNGGDEIKAYSSILEHVTLAMRKDRAPPLYAGALVYRFNQKQDASPTLQLLFLFEEETKGEQKKHLNSLHSRARVKTQDSDVMPEQRACAAVDLALIVGHSVPTRAALREYGPDTLKVLMSLA